MRQGCILSPTIFNVFLEYIDCRGVPCLKGREALEVDQSPTDAIADDANLES